MDSTDRLTALVVATIAVIVISVVTVLGVIHYKETTLNVARDKHFVEHCKLVRTEANNTTTQKSYSCDDKKAE